jgi:thioesterase domain-containing protein
MGEEVGTLALLDSYPAVRDHALHGRHGEEHDQEVIFAGVADDSIRAMLDVLRREGDGLPTFSEEHYQAIKDAYTNNIRLMTRFSPRRFHGDVLLFVATQGETKPPHDIWSPYIGGRIKVHPIDCTHDTMMNPLPAAKIGRILATELNQRPAPRTNRRTK